VKISEVGNYWMSLTDDKYIFNKFNKDRIGIIVSRTSKTYWVKLENQGKK
jgi:uncharacterized membrane protein